MSNQLKHYLMAAIFTVVAVAVMLIGIEGTASFALYMLKIANNTTVTLAERRHTAYDPELGWRNTPGVSIPDMYGNGRGISINSIGIRSMREFSPAPLPNRTRVICTGDSFAFGYGVDNADVWCNVLESYLPRWETINYGQCGYGLDQAFLLYRRDGLGLQPSIHLFTFTGLDFARMLTNEFYGYGKPMLRLDQGILKTTNVPVPRTPYRFAWLRNHKQALTELSIAQLATKVFHSRHDDALASANTQKEQLVLSLFTELVTLNKRANCSTVFIYLPIREDLNGGFDDIRSGLNHFARSNGWRFIDLTDDFKRLTPVEAKQLFIQENDIKQYTYAAGHYSKAGNALVAKLLAQKLAGLSNGETSTKGHTGKAE